MAPDFPSPAGSPIVDITFATRPGHSGRVNYFKSIGGFGIRVTVFTDRRGIRHVITVWKEPLP